LEKLHDLEEMVIRLDSSDWENSCEQLYSKLKPRIQTQKGIVKACRDIFQPIRARQLEENDKLFLSDSSLAGLDDRVNEYTKKIWEINSKTQTLILHDFYQTILNNPSLEKKHPEVFLVARIVAGYAPRFTKTACTRLVSIITRLVVESSSQSNRSNAGVAGEFFVKMMLSRAGLEKGKHYNEQYKSKSGSDTDFVFPYVDDYHDHDVEIFVAVQMSSNDRLRLVSSELKPGAECYAITGNGLAASSKTLQNIGTQILQKAKEKNHKLVCFGPEIKKELDRLKTHKKSSTPGYLGRIEYLENLAISFEQFTNRLQKRFSHL
jgi:hypothetical protein